jgi:3-oxoacyl-[acyl-carrier protein] reductase
MGQLALSGKTCLVTGASRGLGSAVARRLWDEGANLVLAVRDPAYVAALFSELQSTTGQTVVTVALELFDAQSVRSLVARTMAAGVDKLDALVNNAAVLGPVGKVWETPDIEWQNTIVADLVGPSLICSSVIPWMASTGGGKIINLAGGGATGPRENFSAYAAAQAGLVRFSETLAQEARELGIDVNCVAPGPMGTDMLATIERLGEQVVGGKEFLTAQNARAAGMKTLQSAVDLIAFLCSADSNGITGRLISAVWDNWREFPQHAAELNASDVYTLRRVRGRERGIDVLDK